MNPMVRTLLSLQKVQVQSLVRELGYCLGMQAQQDSTPQPPEKNDNAQCCPEGKETRIGNTAEFSAQLLQRVIN